ncbi:hypothetical protein K431DRAFT_48863 [Polychaeton citri CBS 116435]|uniref:Uncharacterized protein n=1 Tax=Polychaeton citri CBS 116435 TaxID=1314669 RepID=A0A9P4URK9_9PEZI|nr:hypothetical protein K431DRAFT_48863 [Polychaeton citri CBS 116435]
MTAAVPRPSGLGGRPAYLDGLYGQPTPSTPSLHSSSSTLSCSSSVSSNNDLKVVSAFSCQQTRPLSPAFEDGMEDSRSIASFRTFSSKFSLRSLLRKSRSRRREPQEVAEIEPFSVALSKATTLQHASEFRPGSRNPSVGKIQTSVSPSRKQSTASPFTDKPLPLEPSEPAQELSCHRCYYFAARNCHGWVMGGGSGDACETCLRAGFFGAP